MRLPLISRASQWEAVSKQRILVNTGGQITSLYTISSFQNGGHTASNNSNLSMRMKAIEIAKAVFDISELREYQAEALMGLLQGRDVVIAQPTYSGKWLVYQLIESHSFSTFSISFTSKRKYCRCNREIHEILNSTKTSWAVLVIQPLIALMKDQIRSMEQRQIKVCRLIHNNNMQAQPHHNSR